MPLYKTEALILRTYKLGEADRIVVFLTRDRGKKRGVANGARRPRSQFAGALEPFTRVGLTYYEREHRDLVRLSYAEPQCSPLRASRPDALPHVGYFAELMDEWAQEGDPNERLFRLGSSTLDALAAGVPTEPLARYFEDLAAAAPGRVSPAPGVSPVRGGTGRGRWRRVPGAGGSRAHVRGVRRGPRRGRRRARPPPVARGDWRARKLGTAFAPPAGRAPRARRARTGGGSPGAHAAAPRPGAAFHPGAQGSAPVTG